MPYKPAGYTDVSPYLIVPDIPATLDFLEAAFGAERLRFFTHEDGTPMHAEARVGDSVVMMGQAPGGTGANVHVYVEDVRAVYAAALKAGGTSVQEPLDKDDGDLRAGVTDPTGTTWWPSTQIADE